MKPGDWEQVRAIYLEGIKSGNSTFETDAPPWERWEMQIESSVGRHWLRCLNERFIAELQR
jgi:L-amino acid N-acyltransferase YncA